MGTPDTTTGSFKEKDNRTPEQEELNPTKKKTTSCHGKWCFKASRADHGTKVNVIRNNRHK